MQTVFSQAPLPHLALGLVRLTGWFHKMIGGLLIGSALPGFIFTLVKTSPTLFGALQFPEQKMAGFVFLLILSILLIFPLLGLAGLFWWDSVLPSAIPAADAEPIANHRVQVQEQRSNDAG